MEANQPNDHFHSTTLENHYLLTQNFLDLPLNERSLFQVEDYDHLIFVHQSIVDIFLEHQFTGAVFISLKNWDGSYDQCCEMIESENPAVIRPTTTLTTPEEKKFPLDIEKLVVDLNDEIQSLPYWKYLQAICRATTTRLLTMKQLFLVLI